MRHGTGNVLLSDSFHLVVAHVAGNVNFAHQHLRVYIWCERLQTQKRGLKSLLLLLYLGIYVYFLFYQEFPTVYFKSLKDLIIKSE